MIRSVARVLSHDTSVHKSIPRLTGDELERSLEAVRAIEVGKRSDLAQRGSE